MGLYPPEVIEKIRKDLRDIRIFCGRYFPFMVIPLSYMRIYAVKALPTAGVSPTNTIMINPEFWEKLSMPEKRFVALHEGLHAIFKHPIRMRGFPPYAFNVAADGKINYAIEDSQRTNNLSGVKIPHGVVTLEAIAHETKVKMELLTKMSVEEITELLLKHAEKTYGSQNAEEAFENCYGRGYGYGLSPEEKEKGLRGDLNAPNKIEGDTIQEGNRELYDSANPDKVAHEWRKLLQRAYSFAKSVGSVPAGLERIIQEVLEVRPPWQISIRFGLRSLLKQDSSFAFPNRRSDDLPGPFGYRRTIWCLIDTSGSISEKELAIFLGLIKHEARGASLRVIAWDADAYEILRGEKPADIAKKIAPRMRGGGGTVIAPVLEKTLKHMRPGDGVLILSDGDIADIEKERTRLLLKRVAIKAGCALFGYTHTPVNAPGFETIFVKIEGGPS
ncbi:MAG TPA: hypothetical protein ENG66_08530 [Thermococcus sp.]|nr:hypothetical protein [Thermococcus sp.]